MSILPDLRRRSRVGCRPRAIATAIASPSSAGCTRSSTKPGMAPVQVGRLDSQADSLCTLLLHSHCQLSETLLTTDSFPSSEPVRTCSSHDCHILRNYFQVHGENPHYLKNLTPKTKGKQPVTNLKNGPNNGFTTRQCPRTALQLGPDWNRNRVRHHICLLHNNPVVTILSGRQNSAEVRDRPL